MSHHGHRDSALDSDLDDVLLAARSIGRVVLYHPPRGRRPAGYDLVPMPAPEQGEGAPPRWGRGCMCGTEIDAFGTEEQTVSRVPSASCALHGLR